jgi:hypothetical protein
VLRIHSDDLWSVAAGLSKRSRKRIAAVAYVSSDAHVRFGRGDVLVTDASDVNVAAGLTSATVLRGAFERGARVYSLAGLHAKVLCLDRISIVGSANFSRSSVSNLIEAAIVTDHPTVLSDALSLVSRLESAAVRVDMEFLERIARIPVTRHFSPAVRGQLQRSRMLPRGAWVVGVHELTDGSFPREAARVKQGEIRARSMLEDAKASTNWIRFTGNSSFKREARKGDTIIQLWRPSSSSRTVRVYFPSPILLRQTEPTCTRFYMPESADDEDRSISLRDFQRLWLAAVARISPRRAWHVEFRMTSRKSWGPCGPRPRTFIRLRQCVSLRALRSNAAASPAALCGAIALPRDFRC